MKIARGVQRIVLIPSRFNFVIKIPIIRFVEGIKDIIVRLKSKNRWKYIALERRKNVYSIISVKKLFFRSIADNWYEFVFYRKTRHPFCEPTYFSFFGLLNIQRKAIPVPFEYAEFRRKCVDIMDREICRDNHHFDTTDNFSFRDGNLMMVDYGAPATQALILDWGVKLSEAFQDFQKPPIK